MNIAIVGLGLMGGSLAYALRGFRNGKIIGYDLRPDVTARALDSGAIDIAADSAANAVSQAELCLFCADPAGILQSVEECTAAAAFKPNAVVSEICGVKSEMVQKLPAMLPKGARYIGMHPMAGKEVGGFGNAEAKIFRGAGFILVPPESYDANALELLRELALYVGAGRVIVNTPEEHDEIIAYSSDMQHIAATALVADYPEKLTLAHTAGAFRDCTRIANIDADLWTELLMGNRGPILPWLDTYIRNLTAVRDALLTQDEGALQSFLSKAGQHKRRIQSS